MSRFHYLVMKPAFDNIEICFMDTDSFLYHIKTDNIEGTFQKLKPFFDFSNYPKEHPLYSTENKNKPGR